MRIVCWFSCGAASAVATKLAVMCYKENKVQADELVIARIRIAEEHPDNDRFAKDCEKWFGHPITTLCNEKYGGSIAKVFEARDYMAGPHGAPCTMLLKKKVRKDFERPGDLHVFGYTVDELKRYVRFKDNPGAPEVWPILIEQNISKQDCYDYVLKAGIELPAMYRLGYNNNNCVGCVKGGAGYWNSIRRDFPEVFAERARQSRKYKARLVSYKGKRIYLDELPDGYGRMVFPKEDE